MDEERRIRSGCGTTAQRRHARSGQATVSPFAVTPPAAIPSVVAPAPTVAAPGAAGDRPYLAR